MRCLKTIFICFLFSCYSIIGNAQFITVNDTYNAQNLVDLLTDQSPCANISNPIAIGDTFSGTQNSYGYFNSGTSNFPFTEGVLLSTWSSTNSIGPYVENVPGPDNQSWLGDSDLDTVLGKSTLNATILEFDFTPLTNFISFDYIFASNEYQSFFPCSYSDAFAFLIKESGSTTPYQNLAVIPNTTIPVSSTNVHPLIPAVNPAPPFGTNGCPAINDAFFGAFNTSTSPINYAGQTVILTAQTNVFPNKTYHIKLVIADNESTTFNSAVFIKAGSFISKIDLGADRLLATDNAICFGENYSIDTKLSASYTYKWYKNNVLLVGETSPSYIVKNAGIYKVEIILNPTVCLATSEIKIEYTPEIVLKNATLVQCDDNSDGITTFDLTKAEPIIKNNNSNLSEMLFFENNSDAQNNLNPILNPNNYTNKTNNQIVIAKVSDPYGCSNYAELTLSIANNTITPPDPIIVCDDDGISDGFYQFDLMAVATSGQFSSIGNDIFVYFYSNATDAYLQINELPTLFKNTTPYEQTIFAKILNGPDCYGIIPITLVVNNFNPPNFEDEKIPLCESGTINISVNNIYSSYLWNTGDTSNTILVTTPGDYFVVVTGPNGCKATKNFHIIASGIATITGATITDFEGNKNSVELQYTGIGDYEFSLDGFYFQDNPIFKGISAGNYLAYARDKNGCGLSNPFVISVLDYPRFFTPNGDGFNDLWTIKNLDLLPNLTITIFNRYGKLLKELSSKSIGWNGTFNEQELPADDYWFHLTFEDGKIIKGHFSLKR